MPQGSLARRYARALMGIGVDNENYDTLGAQIETLAQVMKTSTELSDVLTNPAFPRSDRRKILVAILERMNASATIKNFTLLLLDRERVGALPDISRELNVMIDARIGRVTAVVSSASTLTAAQLDQIKKSLEALSGKQVQIESKEDPDLLGGVVAKVGDIVYDGSLRTQLAQMRNELAG